MLGGPTPIAERKQLQFMVDYWSGCPGYGVSERKATLMHYTIRKVDIGLTYSEVMCFNALEMSSAIIEHRKPAVTTL